MRVTFRNLVGVVIIVNGIAVSDSFASGFALIENSASGMGNAFAGGSAVGEDSSTVFFNPAGMTLLEHEQFVGVLHFIRPKSDFSNDNSTIAPLLGEVSLTGGEDDGGRDAYVPNFYYVRSLDSQSKFGLGVNVPFGLATKYDDDWVGRYHAVESDLRTLNINPSFAHKVDSMFSIGFGMNLQSADIVLSSAIDFGSICYASLSPTICNGAGISPQQNDGFAKLTGNNKLALGWNLGLLFEFSKTSRLGVAYRSKITHHVDGHADFSVPASASFATAGGAFVDTSLSADVTLPDSLSVSAYHAVNSKVALLADVTWTGWSSFDELRIVYDNPSQPDSLTTEDWKNTFRYALGANYQINEKIKLRGGIAYDESPIRNSERRTPRLPGSDRTWLSFGGSYIYNKKMTIDVGYSHLFMSDAKIDNTLESESPLAPAIAADLNGEYTNSVDILSAQLTWKL